MFHMLAFSGAKTDSTANEAVPGVVDNGWTLNAQNRYIMPKKMKCLGAFVENDTLTNARINAPSLRNLGLPDIYPFLVAAITGASPPIDWFGPNGPDLQATEAVGIDASNGASTVDFATAALWVSDGVQNVPTGKRFTMRATSTNVMVADSWTSSTITLNQDLPYGTYSVIGMSAIGTNAQLARLIFPGYTSWRPGAIASPTAGQFDQRQLFRHGNLGEWGQFISTQPPQLECLSHTAGSQAITLWLDLVAVSVPGS